MSIFTSIDYIVSFIDFKTNTMYYPTDTLERIRFEMAMNFIQADQININLLKTRIENERI